MTTFEKIEKELSNHFTTFVAHDSIFIEILGEQHLVSLKEIYADSMLFNLSERGKNYIFCGHDEVSMYAVVDYLKLAVEYLSKFEPKEYTPLTWDAPILVNTLNKKVLEVYIGIPHSYNYGSPEETLSRLNQLTDLGEHVIFMLKNDKGTYLNLSYNTVFDAMLAKETRESNACCKETFEIVKLVTP